MRFDRVARGLPQEPIWGIPVPELPGRRNEVHRGGAVAALAAARARHHSVKLARDGRDSACDFAALWGHARTRVFGVFPATRQTLTTRPLAAGSIAAHNLEDGDRPRLLRESCRRRLTPADPKRIQGGVPTPQLARLIACGGNSSRRSRVSERAETASGFMMICS